MNRLDHNRRAFVQGLSALPLSALLSACGGGGGDHPPPNTAPQPLTRAWKLGFSPNPPRLSVASVLETIDRWALRAELAIIHEETPWTDLLGGMSPDAVIDRDKQPLVDYLRGKGMQLIYMGDLTDGFSRGEEAPQLRVLGRSITEPAVQQVYRDFMLAIIRKLNPEFVGLAAETNLIRAAGPASLYAAVVRTTNDAANDIRAAGGAMPLMASVQVETAWGVLGGDRQFVGIESDRRDFPFIDVLGLSSYPYFGYSQPEDIPTDYYSRLLPHRSAPAMVVEGGWLSANVDAVVSTPEMQARYISRHAALLDSIDARGYLQLNFADPDLASYPGQLPPNVHLFATLGLTDPDYNPKTALAAWDALYGRRLQT